MTTNQQIWTVIWSAFAVGGFFGFVIGFIVGVRQPSGKDKA